MILNLLIAKKKGGFWPLLVEQKQSFIAVSTKTSTTRRGSCRKDKIQRMIGLEHGINPTPAWRGASRSVGNTEKTHGGYFCECSMSLLMNIQYRRSSGNRRWWTVVPADIMLSSMMLLLNTLELKIFTTNMSDVSEKDSILSWKQEKTLKYFYSQRL